MQLFGQSGSYSNLLCLCLFFLTYTSLIGGYHLTTACFFFWFQDTNVVKVIERPLNEKERFMLAKAARCIAFSVCPIGLAPK